MATLTFKLKGRLQQRVDVSPLTPEALADKTAAEIGRIELQCGNRKVVVDHLFEVRQDADGDKVCFEGDGAKFDYVGLGMSRGSIHVCGNAGAYLGHRMQGGMITIDGDVGIFCAAEMNGGKILVRGNAGDFVGGSLPGNRKGMAGGIVIIKGSAGQRAGDHLRRGVILIEGDAGGYLGSRMTAGTIAVMGAVGSYAGYGMKRGTLLLFTTPRSLSPTFNDCGSHTLGFVPLLLRSFQSMETCFSGLAGKAGRVRRYAGDLATLGKGEILVVLEYP
jgi:formylmethanofuran dehydrogenase subunit C